MFTKTFSWSWLKSKKEEKSYTVAEPYMSESEAEWENELLKEAGKVVKNSLYSNGIGTVIFKDGDVHSQEMTVDQLQLIQNVQSKQEFFDILKPKVEIEYEDTFEKEAQLNFLQYKQEVLDLLGEDFNEKNGAFYYKTISLHIDNLILNSLIDAKKENKEDVFQSVLMFWMKSCLIPVKEAREDIYVNIKKFNVKLTHTGNFIGFRRICKVEGGKNKDLIEFISQQYIKIKSQKQSPKNYEVWKDVDSTIFKLTKYGKIPDSEFTYEHVGILSDLYLNLSTLEENHYTDNHTKKYKIKLGETYKIKDEHLDFSYRKSCGGAIHASLGYSLYDYSSFGDTDVICIINPQHMFKSDTGHSGKIGVTQMFIAGLREKDENENFIDIPETDLYHFDEIYHNETVAELEQAIGNKSFEILEVTDVNNITEISPITILDLTTIKNNISKRIINF